MSHTNRFFIFVVAATILVANASAGVQDATGDAITAAKHAAEITKFVHDTLTTKAWIGDWSVADRLGTKQNRLSRNGHIRGRITIVGFRNESVINGTRYVDGNAKEFAIVKKQAYHRPVNGVVKSFKSTYHIFDHGNNTTAVQRTKFHWRYHVDTLLGGYWKDVHESLRVSHTVESPKNFTTRIPDITVQIVSYTRNVSPVTYIYVPIENDPLMKDVVIVNVSYNGSSVHRYDQVGMVQANRRGTEYVNFTDDGWYPFWTKDAEQSVIDHCGRAVTVFDPNFNISMLNISVHTPYETKNIENFTVRAVSEDVKISTPVLKILLVFIGSMIGLVIIGKVITRNIF